MVVKSLSIDILMISIVLICSSPDVYHAKLWNHFFNLSQLQNSGAAASPIPWDQFVPSEDEVDGSQEFPSVSTSMYHHPDESSISLSLNVSRCSDCTTSKYTSRTQNILIIAVCACLAYKTKLKLSRAAEGTPS